MVKRGTEEAAGGPSRRHGKTGGPRPADRRRERSSTTRQQRWTRLGAAVVGLLALLVLGVLSFRDTGTGEGSSTEPTSFELPALDGTGRVALADYRGTPVVVNFFASWCTACDFELPGFAKVSREYRGDIVFVGVNALETGDPDLMPTRHGITWWPLARDVGGANGSGLHDALGGGNSMPLTAFYDADGRLLGVDRAALPENALRQRITDLYGL